MNLIEQLGGYDRASKIANCKSGVVHPTKPLLDALLEYRRANNIFEVGDYALPNSDHSNEVHFLSDWYIKDLDFRCKTKSGGWGVIVKSCMSTAWRHATDEEIKAGHRINHTDNLSHFDHCTAIANHGTPTNKGTDNLSYFDHCSDIRNHVSPNTVVVDHE